MAVQDAQLTEVGLPSASPRRVLNPAVLLQFGQFCLVGLFSTALNVGLFRLFWILGFGKNLSHVCSFSLAVTNGFFLNRAWTFRRSCAGKLERQYLMFVAVNLVGLFLSWMVMSLVGAWLLHLAATSSLPSVFQLVTHHRPMKDVNAYTLGELAATPLCAVWNFTANKLWTFRGHRTDGVKG